MKNKVKILGLFSLIFLLSGCLPFQTKNYPAWTTNGLLESYTLTDGRIVDGWMGAQVGDTIKAKWYDFKVNYVEYVNSYDNYTTSNDKILIHFSIYIKNTSDKDIYLFDGDFALIWNLDKEERNYTYSMDAFASDMLTNDMIIRVGQERVIHTVYEIDKSLLKETKAIYYYEQYSDGQRGNKYYIYI